MIKFCIIFISIFTGISWHFNTVKNTNRLKELGTQFYNSQQYPNALQCYYDLVNKHHLKEEEILLNLAHCYYQVGALEICKKIYFPLSKSNINSIKSQANVQLAILEALNGRRSSALQYLKIALISEPDNKIGRYNYELLLKKNPDEKTSDPKRKTKVSNKNTEGKDAEKETENNDEDVVEKENDGNNPEFSPEKNGSNTNTEGQNKKEKWNTKSIVSKKQSMDKALLMLESIKQQEINYLLQKKYSRHQNKKSKSTMDW